MKKINIIDILIIVVIVAGIAAVGLIKSSGTGTAADAKKLVTLEITEKHEGFSENVVIGDTVTEKVEKNQIGVVVGVEATPCERNSYDRQTGEATVITIPERENVYVTMEVDADAEVAVGKTLSIITKHFTGSGYVTEITDAE